MSALGRNDWETLLPVMVAKGSYNGCDDPALECVLRNPHWENRIVHKPKIEHLCIQAEEFFQIV